jgi:hypothetical protein
MRFVFLLLVLIATVSAKVLTIKGESYDFYSGKPINGSFSVIPIGDFESNISGQIIDGKWNGQIDFDEEKTSKILVITNTSKKIGFNIFEIKKDSKTECRENEIRIKPFVVNSTPVVEMKMEIEETAYKNIPIFVGQENTIKACLTPGKVYKVNLFANGFFSFFYAAK